MPGERLISQDRRPWLIISKREALAILAVIHDYNETTALIPFDCSIPDLARAERVLNNQLDYIANGRGREPDVTDTLIREMRS